MGWNTNLFNQVVLRVQRVKVQANARRLSLSAAGRMSLYRALAPAGVLPADVKSSSSAARAWVLGGESQRSSLTPPAFELLITWLGLASVQLGWGCRGGRSGTCNNLSICSRGQMGGLCGLHPVRSELALGSNRWRCFTMVQAFALKKKIEKKTGFSGSLVVCTAQTQLKLDETSETRKVPHLLHL